MQARLIGSVILVLLALLVLTTILVWGPGVAGADPSPSPTATASPEPEPATAAQVRSALKAKRRAVAARKALSRVRRCFGSRGPVRVYPTPKRAATAEEWAKAQRRWAHQAKDWAGKVKAGVAKMRRPGGHPNGERWLPAARYVGWPESQLGTLVYIMAKRGGTGESGGCPGAFNDVIDCTGLMQMWPGNLAHLPLPKWVRDLSWSAKIRWLKDGMNNLWASLLLWRKCGWGPWAL